MPPFLLNENAPIDFALNLLGGGVSLILVVVLIRYITSKPASDSTLNSDSPPKTKSEKFLWVVVWVVVTTFFAAVAFSLYMFVSALTD
jgi:hypothetical protein